MTVMKFSSFIAVRQIFRNKKKSLVLFLAVFISLSLLIDMMGMYISYKEMMLEDAIENYGAYHFYIKDAAKEECEILKKSNAVENTGYEGRIDTVSVEQYDGQACEAGQKIDLLCMDRTGYELNYLHERGIMLYDSYVYEGKIDLEDGIYLGQIVIESIAPITFVFN